MEYNDCGELFDRPYVLEIFTLNKWGERKGKKCKAWYDKDTIIFHAAFQCLVDYVEKEDPFGKINWNSDPVHKHAAKEIKRLYKWWTEIRPNRKDPLDGIPYGEWSYIKWKGEEREMEWGDTFIVKITPLYGEEKKDTRTSKGKRAFKKHIELEKKWEQEDEDNLIALCKIKGFLWT